MTKFKIQTLALKKISHRIHFNQNKKMKIINKI